MPQAFGKLERNSDDQMNKDEKTKSNTYLKIIANR